MYIYSNILFYNNNNKYYKSQAADTLENESGIIYEEPNMIQFRENILNGEWNEAEGLLPYLKIKDNDINVNILYYKYIIL